MSDPVKLEVPDGSYAESLIIRAGDLVRKLKT